MCHNEPKYCSMSLMSTAPPPFIVSFFERQLSIHLALLHGTEHQLEVVQSLLWGMFHICMESRGLDLWKGDIERLLKSMATHKRDFATCIKLVMLCKSMRDFMECLFALDLVVWRTSCAQFEGNPPLKRQL
jgi:hypothetical protein